MGALRGLSSDRIGCNPVSASITDRVFFILWIYLSGVHLMVMELLCRSKLSDLCNNFRFLRLFFCLNAVFYMI